MQTSSEIMMDVVGMQMYAALFSIIRYLSTYIIIYIYIYIIGGIVVPFGQQECSQQLHYIHGNMLK